MSKMNTYKYIHLTSLVWSLDFIGLLLNMIFKSFLIFLGIFSLVQGQVGPGSVVRIVAPSGKGSASNIGRIRTYIQNLGLVAIMDDDIYSPIEPIYSNTDEFRAEDLTRALLDNETEVIWCVRGGAGAARLIPLLEESLPSTLPQKVFIGFSDITVLHSYFGRKYNWRTIHGPMMEQIVGGFDPTNVEVTLDLMFGRRTSVQYTGLTCLANCSPDMNINASKVVGGNLVLVETGMGTNWDMDTDGNILLLEETGEAPYRVERSLDHFKQAGLLDNVQALLFGDFTGSGDESLNNVVLQRFANSISKPVLRIAGVGHGSTNKPFPLNAPASIYHSSGNSFTINIEY